MLLTKGMILGWYYTVRTPGIGIVGSLVSQLILYSRLSESVCNGVG
jgi:hypothetical protein